MSGCIIAAGDRLPHVAHGRTRLTPRAETAAVAVVVMVGIAWCIVIVPDAMCNTMVPPPRCSVPNTQNQSRAEKTPADEYRCRRLPLRHLDGHLVCFVFSILLDATSGRIFARCCSRRAFLPSPTSRPIINIPVAVQVRCKNAGVGGCRD